MERATARSVWREVRTLVRPVRGRYVGAGAAVVVSTLITLSGPALVRYAVDAGIEKHDMRPLNVAAVVFLCLACLKPFVVRAQILLTIVALIYLSPKLAAISLVALPILVASSWSFHHGAGRAYHAIRDRVAETLTALQEGLAGVRVVQAFRREQRTLERYRPRSQAQVRAWRSASFVNIRLFAFLPLAQASALIVVLLAAASMYRDGAISIGTVTAFVLYLIQLFDPIARFSEWLGEFRQGLAALGKIVGLLRTPNAIVERPAGSALAPKVVSPRWIIAFSSSVSSVLTFCRVALTSWVSPPCTFTPFSKL